MPNGNMIAIAVANTRDPAAPPRQPAASRFLRRLSLSRISLRLLAWVWKRNLASIHAGTSRE